jgi:hypothetical protein
MGFLAILFFVLLGVALLYAWTAGLHISPTDGEVVDKHKNVTYQTYGKGNQATSIPLEAFLLVDALGRTCKVSRGVWANTKVGDIVRGRWR